MGVGSEDEPGPPVGLFGVRFGDETSEIRPAAAVAGFYTAGPCGVRRDDGHCHLAAQAGAAEQLATPPVDYISTYQPTWYGFVTNEPTEAAEAEAWYALIERLQPDGGVTGTPEWAEQASTLLAWGHRVRQGITDQY